MTFPSNLNALVEQLTIAKKRLAYLTEQTQKMTETQKEVDRLTQELELIVDRLGFTPEAVDLLLAAR